jgi:hypothetical protein
MRLVVLAPVNTRLLDGLESHCRATKRPTLATAILEQALTDPALADDDIVKYRRRLVELHIGEANTPESAMAHVESLAEHDPTDEVARRAAERLLGTPAVGSRAAAVLQTLRRLARQSSPDGKR